MVSKIHKALHVEVQLAETFSHPTIRKITDYIRSAVKAPYTPIESMETNQTRVRVIMENANSYGLENRATAMILIRSWSAVG